MRERCAPRAQVNTCNWVAPHLRHCIFLYIQSDLRLSSVYKLDTVRQSLIKWASKQYIIVSYITVLSRSPSFFWVSQSLTIDFQLKDVLCSFSQAHPAVGISTAPGLSLRSTKTCTHIFWLWQWCASPGPWLSECTGSWNSPDTLDKRRLHAGQDGAFMVLFKHLVFWNFWIAYWWNFPVNISRFYLIATLTSEITLLMPNWLIFLFCKQSPAMFPMPPVYLGLSQYLSLYARGRMYVQTPFFWMHSQYLQPNIPPC